MRSARANPAARIPLPTRRRRPSSSTSARPRSGSSTIDPGAALVDDVARADVGRRDHGQSRWPSPPHRGCRSPRSRRAGRTPRPGGRPRRAPRRRGGRAPRTPAPEVGRGVLGDHPQLGVGQRGQHVPRRTPRRAPRPRLRPVPRADEQDRRVGPRASSEPGRNRSRVDAVGDHASHPRQSTAGSRATRPRSGPRRALASTSVKPERHHAQPSPWRPGWAAPPRSRSRAGCGRATGTRRRHIQ